MSIATAPGTTGLSVATLVPGVAPVPQVNLLPPEIRASRSLAQLKRVLLLLLVLVVALVGAGFFWATLQVSSAQDELAAEEAETARLLEAQQEYAEVPLVLADLEAAKDARIVGMSTEVLWADTLVAFALTAPAGASFEEIAMVGDTPTTWAAPPANPLVDRGVATITFVGRSATFVDVSAWMTALESVPGLTDAYVTSVAIQEEDVDGTLSSYYQVSGSVNVTEAAHAQRFVVEEEG